jgi:hypothetical protein
MPSDFDAWLDAVVASYVPMPPAEARLLVGEVMKARARYGRDDRAVDMLVVSTAQQYAALVRIAELERQVVELRAKYEPIDIGTGGCYGEGEEGL